MPFSSTTSTLAAEQPSLDIGRSISLHSLDRDLSKTEAHINPNVADDEPGLLDVEKAHTGIDPHAFPDGGLEAWLVVSGAFCCMFCSFGWVNCMYAHRDSQAEG